MDNKLFLIIYRFGQKNKSMYNLLFKVTHASVLFFQIMYAILLLYAFIYVNSHFYKIVLAPLASLALNYILRYYIKRPRPYIQNTIPLPFNHKGGYSFPSNHACSSMAIAISYLYIIKPLGFLLILCALITGFSRVTSGLHYPFDILSGFLIAAICSLFYVIII
ncbi:MAG: phosphatase PAP2 family protein [Clostridiales bacterium]|jgi:undecaprenyl-diphosphatase|nr:phosphatase PAP2 family protein [Clostridiales bacterium]